MYLAEPFNFKTISNTIPGTIIIVVISLTNLHRGLTSQVKTDNSQRSEVFSKGMNSEMFLPERAFENIASSSLEPSSLPALEKQKSNHASGKSAALKNYKERIFQDNKKQLKVVEAPNANEQFVKRLSSHTTHTKFVDLSNSNVESNFYSNSSSEMFDKPVFKTPMYFGTENSTVIATQTGATAHISCVVHNIGECVVSWIRKKDYHLLTVGLTAYSSDERFSATHLKHSEDWTLQIKFVQQRDAGIYECQVSTHPPTSIFLHLLVVEARAEISGPNIRYLTPGSTLRLHCHVVQNTESSEYIFWYHDNRMINYDVDRGINVSTEPDFQSSELIISRTRREHSGNYTCVASNTQPASVLIHIFKGDNPAAMYHGHVGSSTKSYQTQLLHILMAIVATIYGSFVKRK